MRATHRRIEDFTMEGVYRVDPGGKGLGTEVSQWGPGHGRHQDF